MKRTISSKELNKMVMEQIGETLPPWIAGYDPRFILATNALTGKAYQGNNQLMGMYLSQNLGGNLFATSKQWFKLAKQVGYFDQYPKGKILKRDDDGKTVSPVGTFVFHKVTKRALKDGESCPDEYKITDNEGKEYRKGIIFNTFLVHHESQVQPELVEMVKEKKFAAKKHAEISEIKDMVESLKMHIEIGRPSYRPSNDTVYMPLLETYESPARYYESLLHELGHWTGYTTRMNREGISDISFGSGTYSFEECIAEWFALLANAHFGIVQSEKDTANMAKYIQGWSKSFKQNPEMLMDAFKQAEKAWSWVKEVANIKEESEGEGEEEAA